MSGLNWDKARKRDQARDGKPSPQRLRHRKPSQRQLAYLKHLRRERGITGKKLPKTLEAASVEIDRLLNGDQPPIRDLAADIELSVARRVQDSS